MPVPWLRLLDLALGVTNFAQMSRTSRTAPEPEPDKLIPGSRALGQLETRLAGVVVAALREAFDRDTHRLELERQHMEAERARAERVLQLELRRQAGEREIGRLRLVAGVAVVSWLGTLFFAARLAGGAAAARVAMATGLALLIAALSAAFAAQSSIGRALDRTDDGLSGRDALESAAGTIAPWLIVAGLAVIGVAVLLT